MVEIVDFPSDGATLRGRFYSLTALTCAAALPGVDPARMAQWGDSLSAAVALVVAGVDDRVAAVVAQLPDTGRETAPPDPDGALYAALCETSESGEIRGEPEETIGPLPVASADQIHAPPLLTPIQAYRWFIEYGGPFGLRYYPSAWFDGASTAQSDFLQRVLT